MKLQAMENELLEPGWMSVYRPSEFASNIIPAGKGRLAALVIGQRVRPKKVRARRQSGLNEAGLIHALQEKGIGRPATYALIVEALLARKYTERGEEGRLRMTKKGSLVYEFLMGQFPTLFEFTYTARMETALDNVAGGKLSYGSAIGDLWRELIRR